MSAKTIDAFLCGVTVTSTGTAASLTNGHLFYEPSEIRVLRVRLVNDRYVSRSIFHVAPSGG